VICIALGCSFAALVEVYRYRSLRSIAEYEQTGNSSEVFSTAGRSIFAGLAAADVVSKWTWAATLLQSSNAAWNYGVSGPFWHASGATVQVFLFTILAIEIKRKCPGINTVLEVVHARWGTTAHMVFLFFCLLTCLIVTAMLILGGAETINALTGMSVYWANFMIPVPVMIYTCSGGLKSSYYASFTHTAVIYLSLLIFLWKIYSGPSDIGAVDKMHDNLICAAVRNPVPRNKYGQYITMNSLDGLMFGIINTVGNFGTVFVDQSYWRGAQQCKPSATYRGYLLGGMAWFAIPFSMATALGLAGRALDLPLTGAEAGRGLVLPAVAVHLMGRGGAFLVAFQLFVAITFTANSEQLAVSSLITYDVYKRYLNNRAAGHQMIMFARATVCVWAIFSGIIATILNEMGISLGWLCGAMGIFIGSAVLPIVFSLMWKDCSGVGAMAGAIVGQITAIVVWCIVATAQDPDGKVNVNSLGDIDSLFAGNVCAIGVSGLVCAAISFACPQNFHWDDLRCMTDCFNMADDADPTDSGEDEKEAMDIAYKWTAWFAVVMSVVLVILWPLLSLSADPFSKSYFSFWVGLPFLCVTVLLPIYEFVAHKKEEAPAKLKTEEKKNQ
jgi:SSS family transporter